MAFEVIGGLLLVLGVYSRWIAALAVVQLFVAATVHFGNGWSFTNANGGWEYPIYLCVTALVVALLAMVRLRQSLPAKPDRGDRLRLSKVTSVAPCRRRADQDPPSPGFARSNPRQKKACISAGFFTIWLHDLDSNQGPND
jgi:hypothetical protein